jgi:hypothetical protein
MAKLRLKISYEIESEDVPPEVLYHFDIASAHIVEELEAKWATALEVVAREHPGLKIKFGDWNGEVTDL